MKTFWISRAEDECGDLYYAHRERPRGRPFAAFFDCFCPEEFEALTGVKLEPGSAPKPFKLIRADLYEIEE